MKKVLFSLTVVLWAALIIATFIRSLNGDHSVFNTFYGEGGAWLQAEPLFGRSFGNFQYWPGFAALMAPFSLLPFSLSGIVFSALSFSLYGWAIWQCAQLTLPRGQRFWMFLLVFPPSFEGFINQQSNPLLGAAVILGVLAVFRRNWWQAAFWFLIPGIIKIGPFCFALLFAVIFLKELSARLAVMLLAFIGLPFLLQRPEYVLQCYQDWVNFLIGQQTDRHFCYRDMWTLWEFCVHGKVHYDMNADMTVYKGFQVLMAVLTALFCFPWRQWWRGDSAPRNLPPLALIFLPLMAGAWWFALWGPSTEIATGTLFAIGPTLGLVFAWFGDKTRPAGNALSATSNPLHNGKWLMTAAYILICLGLSGDLEWHLKHALPGQTWFQTFLPAGGVLFGIWLFVYAKQALIMFFSSMPASTSSSATEPAAIK